MKTIKEILILGGITALITFLLNILLENLLPDTFDFWLYDSLSSFIISLVLIILSPLVKKNKNFDLFLRYSFSNFLIFTVYNFVYALKISFGTIKFCVPEKILNEKLYEISFVSNFLVFLSTLFFLVLFKERTVNIFTKNSVIYIVLIFILIIGFRIQNLLFQTLDMISRIF